MTMTNEEREDAILATPSVSRRLIGKKVDGLKTVHRCIIVYGSEVFGYIASYEEWFSKYPGHLEFYEVRLQTPIFATPNEAEANARNDARCEAEADGFKLSRWQRYNPAWPSAIADKRLGFGKQRMIEARKKFATVTGYSSPTKLVEAIESGEITIHKP